VVGDGPGHAGQAPGLLELAVAHFQGGLLLFGPAPIGLGIQAVRVQALVQDQDEAEGPQGAGDGGQEEGHHLDQGVVLVRAQGGLGQGDPGQDQEEAGVEGEDGGGETGRPDEAAAPGPQEGRGRGQVEEGDEPGDQGGAHGKGGQEEEEDVVGGHHEGQGRPGPAPPLGQFQEAPGAQ